MLNNRMDSSGGRFKVFNAAVSGSNSAYAAAHIEELIDRYRPDMVVAMIGYNDRIPTSGMLVKYDGSMGAKIRIFLSGLRIYRTYYWIKAGLFDMPERAAEDALSLAEGAKDETAYSPGLEEANSLFERGDFGLAEQAYRIFLQELADKSRENYSQESQEEYSRRKEAELATLRLSEIYRTQERFDEETDLLGEFIAANPESRAAERGWQTLICLQAIWEMQRMLRWRS
jgi:hypothetical protein